MTPLARGRLAVLAALVVVTVGAWALTIHQARTMDMAMGIVARGASSEDGMGTTDDMAGMAMDDAGAMAMAGMSATDWSLASAAAFLAVWAVMMAAMMFPAAAPMLLLFQTVYAKRKAQSQAFVPTWVFAAGYLLVWTAVGAMTYALIQLGRELASGIGAGGRDTWAPIALGATLVLAGLYQLTPLKRVCLDHCRTPLGFVMTHWREGRLGALRMGGVHGAYCLGCCWALFAVLVAAGVMSLAWMLLLTLVVFAEKVIPHGKRVSVAVGVGFVVLGLLVAGGAANMPWMA
jgi:predicted metal-binding membrane protein